MFINGNVRTGAATSVAEGTHEIYLPEDVRVYRVGVAIDNLSLSMGNTYPDVLAAETIPDTIAATAETSSDPVAASNAARATNLHLIQGTVQNPEWN